MGPVTASGLTSIGRRLDLSPVAFGEMRDSSGCVEDLHELRARMAHDGYLLLRGFLDSEPVLQARREVLDWLAAEGLLAENRPIADAIAAAHADTAVTPEAHRFPLVRRLTHAGRHVDFFTRFLGGEVRAFDYIWMRLMSPGAVTGPHCDIVYKGRGTPNLYTTWTPLGDVPLSDGALMILERSHLAEALRSDYCRMDIDKDRNWKKLRYRHGMLFRGGDYSRNPRAVQRRLGLRWLTTNYEVGDVVMFTAFTMHASLDNISSRIRISTDTRYQLASEPVDARWIGENPVAHSQAE